MTPRVLRLRAAAVAVALLIAATSAAGESSFPTETLPLNSVTDAPTISPVLTMAPGSSTGEAVTTPPATTVKPVATAQPTKTPAPTTPKPTKTPAPTTVKPTKTPAPTTPKPAPTPAPTVVIGSCLGLQRNTLLASCPTPCLNDAPCIVYSQNAEHTLLTGCDYATASKKSLCASQPTETCEFHCFAKYGISEEFHFTVRKAGKLGDPVKRAAVDPKLIAKVDDDGGFQSNEFVSSIGGLNLSKKIATVDVSGDSSTTAGFVNVSIDSSLLANTSSVTALKLTSLPLQGDRLEAIIESTPSKLNLLGLRQLAITNLSWKMFERLPNLKTLDLAYNQIPLVAGGTVVMPALTSLTLLGNKLAGFDLLAPNLGYLHLHENNLVRIPQSVFSYTKLIWLNMNSNPVIRPLVLTQEQLNFLEELVVFNVELVDPPDAAIVSRLPKTGGQYGDYWDDVDLSLLLKGAKEVLLLDDRTTPVRVVDSETAAKYNNLLELRARNRVAVVTPGPTPPQTNPADEKPGSNSSSGPDGGDVPDDLCQAVPRRGLQSNCAEGYCPTNGACVMYDRSTEVAPFSGCNYTIESKPSFCTRANQGAKTCEILCFGAYQQKSQFKFFIPFKTALASPVPRLPYHDDLGKLTTSDVPFLTNSLIDKINKIDLKEGVTEVLIGGGRSEKVADRLAEVTVNSYLLANAPSVTSLTLLNIDLSKSNVEAIIKNTWQPLEVLNLRHTNLATFPASNLRETQDSLEKLTLAQNWLTTFDTETKALPKLTSLDVSDNSLVTFNINAPNLKTLALNGNNLVRIPPSVFNLKSLQTLDLKSNPIAFPLVLSDQQAKFLAAVPDVHFDAVGNPDPSGDIPSGPSTGPSTGSSTGASPTAVPGGNGAAGTGGGTALPNGSTTVVKGVPVIIVSEPIANAYNEKLEQKQKESTPTTRPRNASGTPGSTPGKTRSPSSNALNATGLSTERSQSSGSGSFLLDGSGDDYWSEEVGWTDSPSDISNTGTFRPASSSETNSPSAGNVDAASTKSTGGISLGTKLMLVGLGSAFVVAVVVCLVIVFKRRKRKTSQDGNYAAMADQANAPAGSAGSEAGTDTGKVLAWWKDEAMLSNRLNAGDISDVRVIGSGSSGVVWLVNYRSGTRKLVSKRLIKGEGAAYEAKVLALYAEAEVGTELHYPSIVQFVGVAWTDKTDFQVLYEYMSNGDLSTYLAKTDAATLPWLPKKLQIAIDIIEALVYAHSFNPPLLHRDLKSSNVLLDENNKAKLGDFGCARPESDSNTMTSTGVGTSRWLAPEILLGSTSYGTSSDIYSFGVLLCELDTHQMPYAEEAQELASESALLQRVARGELRPSMSSSCPVEIREMAEVCLAFDPAERPTAMQVSYKLRSLLRQHQRK